MTAYVILLLVLAGVILVAAVLFDRRRGRAIDEDLQEEPPARSWPPHENGRHRAD